MLPNLISTRPVPIFVWIVDPSLPGLHFKIIWICLKGEFTKKLSLNLILEHARICLVRTSQSQPKVREGLILDQLVEHPNTWSWPQYRHRHRYRYCCRYWSQSGGLME